MHLNHSTTGAPSCYDASSRRLLIPKLRNESGDQALWKSLVSSSLGKSCDSLTYCRPVAQTKQTKPVIFICSESFRSFLRQFLFLLCFTTKFPGCCMYYPHTIRDAHVPAPPILEMQQAYSHLPSCFPIQSISPSASRLTFFPLFSALRLLRSPNSNSNWAQTDGRTLFHFSEKRKKKKENVSLVRLGEGKRTTASHRKADKLFPAFSPLPHFLFAQKKEGPLGDDQLEEEKDIPPPIFGSLSHSHYFFSPGRRK